MSFQPLTKTQRKYLKANAHHLKPVLQLGKEGPTPAFMNELLAQLEIHELIKLRVLKTCLIPEDVLEQCFADAEIHFVQKIGHIYSLYKQRERDHILHLPKE